MFILGDCADNLLYPPAVNVANKTVDKFVPLTVRVMRDLSARVIGRHLSIAQQ